MRTDGTNFIEKGGFSSMDDAMEKGMVLVMSIWDDHDVNMLWLDSTYPVNGTNPGDARGTCATTSGVPATVEKEHADAKVTYSNIRFGEIGSTTPGAPPTPGPPAACACTTLWTPRARAPAGTLLWGLEQHRRGRVDLRLRSLPRGLARHQVVEVEAVACPRRVGVVDLLPALLERLGPPDVPVRLVRVIR